MVHTHGNCIHKNDSRDKVLVEPILTHKIVYLLPEDVCGLYFYHGSFYLSHEALDLDPFFLLIREPSTSLRFLFLFVELTNDDRNEKVHHEESRDENEGKEKD